MFLEISGLTVDFGKTRALDGVTLSLDAGDIAVVYGENGAGKSTLLWAVSGLLIPTAGHIRMLAMNGSPRPSIGFLAHQSFLYEDLTVIENLVLAARLFGLDDPRGRADDLARQMGLAPYAEKRVSALSRGQIQLTAFARAVLPASPLILLDEPFSNLDSAGIDKVCRKIQDMRSPERLILMATHDRSLGQRLSTAVLEMRAGTIIRKPGIHE